MQQSLVHTRRNVIIGACVVWGLVIVGLALASYQTVELEIERMRAEQRESHDDTVALAMYRMENIDSQVRKHHNHEFEVFKPEYQLSSGSDPDTGAPLDVDKLPIVPSPLNAEWPDWVLFHFQAGPSHWVSPQLGGGSDLTTPAAALSKQSRESAVGNENWFAALRQLYDAEGLHALFTEAQEANERRSGYAGGDVTEADAPKQKSTPLEPPQYSRTLQESNRREQRIEQSGGPQLERCECRPNILAETVYRNRSRHAVNECLEYTGTVMLPVWLDLSLDGRKQLALLRYVHAVQDESKLWVVQGVLFDWPKLKSELEATIHDLLPNAHIEPVALDASPSSTMLNSIPAQLVAEMPVANVASMAVRRLGWGLSLIWFITLAAVAATIYGALRYFRMVERRMRFTSAVTHELRTPLTSFQLYSDLLGDLRDDEGEQRRKYVSVLQRESRRLSKLVENVFAYSRVAESGAKVLVKPMRTQALLDDLARDTEQYRNNGSHRALVIDNQVDPEMTIDTDPNYVSQILINLVENACKYGGSDQIFVTARPNGNEGLMLEVDDSGPGIEPSELNTIFDPFQRGKDAKSQSTGGMGLGLALSRFWADCLQGKLSVRRSERNGGHFSCFVLELPSRLQRK